jgi:enterochelin esterase-like enzyme
MQTTHVSGIQNETIYIESVFLKRRVIIDLYRSAAASNVQIPLLLINDGQDLGKMGFNSILDHLVESGNIKALFCAGIHCSEERKREYGIAGQADYKGRGDKAGLYTSFVMEELLPVLQHKNNGPFSSCSYAGFSLGALSALDIAWNHGSIFSKVGLFSASLWWRSVDQLDPLYDDDKHRIMHQQIRFSNTIPALKFFFQCGNLDETRDRNKNGIIDSIDDTLDLIKELKLKGFKIGKDIEYLELSDGRHDVGTWGRAMPVFLKWAFNY